MTITISRRVDRIAYPRNGNVHNPTKYYMWDILVDGRVAYRARTLREAKATLPAIAKEFAGKV